MSDRAPAAGKGHIPGSPIAGEDGISVDVGRTEVRRARANVEIFYRCEPGEWVDIQARIFDCLDEVARIVDPDLGNVLAAVDLTEHVVLSIPSPHHADRPRAEIPATTAVSAAETGTISIEHRLSTDRETRVDRDERQERFRREGAA